MKCIHFLSRQGLALRGNKDESNGNLCQLLFNKAEEDTNLTEWLKKEREWAHQPRYSKSGDQALWSRNISRYHLKPPTLAISDNNGLDYR